MSLCQCVCLNAPAPIGIYTLALLVGLRVSGFLLMTMSASEAVGVVVEAGLDDTNAFMLADHGLDDAAVGSLTASPKDKIPYHRRFLKSGPSLWFRVRPGRP